MGSSGRQGVRAGRGEQRAQRISMKALRGLAGDNETRVHVPAYVMSYCP